MKILREVQRKTPRDWEIIIFGCRRCATLWKLETEEEATKSLEMWGLGAFAYFSECPTCGHKANAVSVPLHPEEEALYLYIRELQEGG